MVLQDDDDDEMTEMALAYHGYDRGTIIAISGVRVISGGGGGWIKGVG